MEELKEEVDEARKLAEEWEAKYKVEKVLSRTKFKNWCKLNLQIYFIIC